MAIALVRGGDFAKEDYARWREGEKERERARERESKRLPGQTCGYAGTRLAQVMIGSRGWPTLDRSTDRDLES